MLDLLGELGMLLWMFGVGPIVSIASIPVLLILKILGLPLF